MDTNQKEEKELEKNMEKENNIERCWTHIKKYWKEEWFLMAKEEWKEFIENERKIPESKKDLCLGCGEKVTKISLKEKVCYFCDNYCQPMLANPKWAYLVEKFIPEHKDKLNLFNS